ncbi:D-alanyl-lipoteichoic acid acyltransferase DltB (MBOAT superfamily) [Pedobacter sp. UYP24]
MIQRIQSVWLLLASLTLLLLLVVPVIGTVNGTKEFWIQATGLFQQENGVTTKIDSFRPLYISVVALAILALAIIFNFKSRTFQKRMIGALIAMIVGISFWTFNFAQQIPGGLELASYKAGIALPLLAIIFCALAMRGITKDEQLLRSAERLR